MFTDYLYVSGASDTLKAHLVDLSRVVVERANLGPDDLVIDIGCNDQTLLKGFREMGVKVLGVDPAENLALLNQDSGIDHLVDFFNSATSEKIVKQWGKASAITATNTFPHIPDLPDFVEGIKTALAPGGVLVLEMHYLLDMLEQGAFDTIYHEHVSYWALHPMKALFERFGMEITSAERLPLHHGQLRVFVQRQGEGVVQPSVAQVLDEEASLGIGSFDTHLAFAQKAYQIKETLGETLGDLVAKGHRVAGYGAPAKGNTLLDFLGIGSETIEYIVDRSSLKQGRYTPGAHIPIVAPERLLQDQPEYVVLLAWNFAEEVLEQQAEYRRLGGKFIIPIPQAEIV
jgi:SAM-dependent methyltransferase